MADRGDSDDPFASFTFTPQTATGGSAPAPAPAAADARSRLSSLAASLASATGEAPPSAASSAAAERGTERALRRALMEQREQLREMEQAAALVSASAAPSSYSRSLRYSGSGRGLAPAFATPSSGGPPPLPDSVTFSTGPSGPTGRRFRAHSGEAPPAELLASLDGSLASLSSATGELRASVSRSELLGELERQRSRGTRGRARSDGGEEEGSDASAPWRAKALVFSAKAATPASVNEPAHEQELLECLAHLCEACSALPSHRWSSARLLPDMAAAIMPQVLTVLQSATSRNVLLQTSRLFWYLTRADANKSQLQADSQIATVVAALTAHAADARIARNLIVALSNVALQLDSAGKLAAVGGFGAVGGAALAHAGNADVSDVACTFLYHALDHAISGRVDRDAMDHDFTTAFPKLTLDAGLHRVLVAAIARLEPSARFARNVAAAGRTLARCEGALPALLDAGALPAYFAALRRLDADGAGGSDIADYVRDVLLRLLQLDEGAVAVALGAEGAPLTALGQLLTLRSVTGAEDLLTALSEVYTRQLQQLPGGEDTRAVVLACPSPIPLLNWLARAGDALDPAATTWLLQRLMALCFDGAHRGAVRQRNGLRVMTGLMASHGEDGDLMAAAVGVVWLLCFSDDARAFVKRDEQGILSLMQHAQITLSGNGPLQERFAAIRSMCKLGGGGAVQW